MLPLCCNWATVHRAEQVLIHQRRSGNGTDEWKNLEYFLFSIIPQWRGFLCVSVSHVLPQRVKQQKYILMRETTMYMILACLGWVDNSFRRECMQAYTPSYILKQNKVVGPIHGLKMLYMGDGSYPIKTQVYRRDSMIRKLFMDCWHTIEFYLNWLLCKHSQIQT